MASQSRKARAQTPVTHHPLFPAIVALWFGALFGLGSLVIRPGLIESLVLATGIDTVVSAAAPPLGPTARILIALTMAALGGALGAAIARRVARPRPVKADISSQLERVQFRARDAHPDAPARRPLSVPDEISAAALGEPAPAAGAYPGRRRALAIAEEAPQFRAHEYAPLPGDSEHAAPWSQPYDLAEPEPDPEMVPLELGDFAAPAEVDAVPLAFEPVAPQPHEPEPALSEAFVPEPVHQTFQPFARPEPAAEAAAPFAAPAFAPPVAAPIDFARMGQAEPISFPAALAEAKPAIDPSPAEPGGPAADAPEPAPLGELDLVALTERFAASLRRRRALQAGADAAEPAAAVPEAHAAPIPAEPPVAAATQWQALPAALRPVGFDVADEEDDTPLDSLVPLRGFHLPAQPSIAPEPPAPEPAEDEAESEEAEGYSSLLELGKPLAGRQSFVRIEEPDTAHAAIEPVVIFPGQAARGAPASPQPLAIPQPFAAPQAAAEQGAEPAPAPAGTLRRFDAPGNALAGQPVTAGGIAPQADPEETERALRAALATLQRMSGAA